MAIAVMAVKFRVNELLKITKELAVKNPVLVDSPLAIPDDCLPAGQLNEAQKNLFTTLMQLAEKADMLRVKLQYCTDAPEKANLLREKQQAESLVGLLTDILWFEVKESFELYDKSVIGIATEWTVWYRDKPEDGECDCPACTLIHKLRLGSFLKDSGISG